MPPPMFAVLPEMVELVTVRVASTLLKMPPPLPPSAKFPEMVELETVRLPELLKAPPIPEVFAPVTVTPEMLRLPPEAISKILKSLPLTPLSPLMVSVEAPGPVMVRVPRVPAPTVPLALRI